MIRCVPVPGRFLIAPEKPSNSVLSPKSDRCKALHRDELSARDLRRGGGSEDLHPVPERSADTDRRVLIRSPALS